MILLFFDCPEQKNSGLPLTLALIISSRPGVLAKNLVVA